MADPEDTFLIVAAGLLGVLGLLSGIQVRRGRFRYALRDYANANRSVLWRHLALVQIPAGIAFMLATLGMAMYRAAGNLQGVAGIPTGIALILFALAIAWLPTPPTFLKPVWIQEIDRRDTASDNGLTKFEKLAWWVVAGPIIVIIILTGLVLTVVGLVSVFAS